jgi:Cu/Ag efflux pump CusA
VRHVAHSIFALGAGSQMLQPLAIAVIGGLLIPVILSLIITPAMYYHLTSKCERAWVEEPHMRLSKHI